MEKRFLQHGVLLSEKMINGRPVALFEFDTPLPVGPWLIPVVELPWPGENAIAMKAGSTWKLCCAVRRRS